MEGAAALHGMHIPREAFTWLLASLHHLSRRPFDAARVASKFPPPHDRISLLSALRALGFRAGERKVGSATLRGLPVPAVIFRASEAGELVPALLVTHDGERMLYFEPHSEKPRAEPLSQFDTRFDPMAILVAAPEAGEEPVVGFPPEPRRFGLGWFVPEILKHRAVWRDVLLASLAIQLVGLATPLFTQVVIDKVVVHQTTSTLVVVAAGLALFLVFNAVMTWLRQYLVIHTGNRVDAVLATDVLAHLLHLPLPYFERRPTGVTVARLQGVETIREFITGASVAALLDLPFLLIVLALMFAYSWQLSLIALGVVLLLGALSLGVTPLLRERLNRQFMLGARNQAFLTEYVAGAEAVKSLQLEPALEKRYGDYLASYLRSTFSARMLSSTYSVAANALEQLMTVAILVAGALLVMRNDGFTIGMLVAFQMFSARMAQPMLRLAALWQEWQQAQIALRRLGDILDCPREADSLVPSRAADSRGLIEARGLAFRYGEDRPYLYRDLDFTIRPGTLVAVTGPSGCGKSTLAKLLLGFYAPTQGRLQLDGRDLRHLSTSELRQSFGVVPQETTLFSGTVYDNLVMGAPNAGLDDVASACRAAGIHEAIEQLPQGYRTPIGEHGVGLSGGQKQRIAIARALLKRPRILVFDEATSSLDEGNAERLAHTINGLRGTATILFISHAVPRGLAPDDTLALGAGAPQRSLS